MENAEADESGRSEHNHDRSTRYEERADRSHILSEIFE